MSARIVSAKDTALFVYGRGKELLVARQRGDYRRPMKATSIFVEESPDGADVWASAGTVGEANVCLAIVSFGHVFVNWERALE